MHQVLRLRPRSIGINYRSGSRIRTPQSTCRTTQRRSRGTVRELLHAFSTRLRSGLWFGQGVDHRPRRGRQSLVRHMDHRKRQRSPSRPCAMRSLAMSRRFGRCPCRSERAIPPPVCCPTPGRGLAAFRPHRIPHRAGSRVTRGRCWASRIPQSSAPSPFIERTLVRCE